MHGERERKRLLRQKGKIFSLKDARVRERGGGHDNKKSIPRDGFAAACRLEKGGGGKRAKGKYTDRWDELENKNEKNTIQAFQLLWRQQVL